MNQLTRDIIEKYQPMWTNKQVWEFDQINENLTFDIAFTKVEENNTPWNSKNIFLNSNLREVIVENFIEIEDKMVLIANRSKKSLEEQYFPYVLAVIADIMIDEEIPLIFEEKNACLSFRIDDNADVIDCKEFFEEFYHLATGFNYDTDTGIPEDETEAELYLTRLQEEFDDRMKLKLGEKYMPGNNDPDTINAEE